MRATTPRPIPISRPRRLQARPLYLVPARLPRLRRSHLKWYLAAAELIGSLLLVLAAAWFVWRMVPWH